jgi:small subunit ribosomal protein S19
MASKKKGMTNAGAARRKQRKAQAAIETRQKKEFTYRGKTIAELKELSLNDVLDIMPSGIRRSYTRGVKSGEKKLMDRIESIEPGSVVLRTHYRHLAVLPRFVGHRIAVYDGREFREVTVSSEMIGHRLGEFAPPTTVCAHSGVGVGATRSSKHVPLK